MERCPSCGEMVRGGARYCTTCGYRMPEPLGEAPSGIVNADTPASDPASSGWPEYAPSSPESAGALAGHASPPNGDLPDTAASEPAREEESASFWPVAPAAAAASQDTPVESAEQETIVAVASEIPVDESEESAESPARERVLALIDEVRQFVVAIPNEGRDDLRGVVAELEVASTTPGAFDPDELASLRDALLAARDRPRDLDTVLDLTSRIDSLVALAFAYERSHAAIERALDVLRRS